jgi:hypothetical protein
LVRKTGEARVETSAGSPVSGNAKSNGEPALTTGLLILIVFTIVFALGFLESQSENSWVVRSPLFNVVGAVGCMVLMVVIALLGAIWWFITGSKDVLDWVVSVTLVGRQPYRSLVGLFFVLTICMEYFIRFLKWLKRT